MLLASAVLFLGTLAVLFADNVVRAAALALRRLGLLKPAAVDFDGLLDELFARWPLEADERCEEEIMAEEAAELEALRWAAE